MGALRKLWALWKAFAHRLGLVQTAILLSLVYHVAVGPIGLLGRLLRRDLLGLRPAPGVSYWETLPETTRTLERARKQF
jgi:hypothetical protein